MTTIATEARHAVARDLMQAAVCNTGSQSDAVSALLMAAGQLLDRSFGPTRSLAILRTVVDATEAALIDREGQQPGEAVQ